jgi:cytochrome c oxidase cbb3-type subunit III
MSEPASPTAPRRSRARAWGLAAVGLLILVCAGLGVLQLRRQALERSLLATSPFDVAAHPDLVRFASEQAKPIYARECASCHGLDMKGLAPTGAPNLTDQVWLYGDGRVFDIERTILYGIRSGHKKSHDVTEMPAFGLRGQIPEAQIDEVVQYLLKLNGQPNENAAADRGKAVFESQQGSCTDCHGADAKGDSNSGAPDLTINVWNYGGDPRALHDSIYYGHHGVMPAWIGKLTLEQIRALSVYIYAASHR